MKNRPGWIVTLAAVLHSWAMADALLVNGSFEYPVIGVEPPNHIKSWAGGKIVTYHEDDVPGWGTTASDHEIEFWRGDAGKPFEGNQFIELNANEVASVYQDVPTIPGKKFHWFVAHRGRNGVDVAEVRIGDPNDSSSLKTVETMTDDKDAWGTYKGTYIVPEGQSVTRLQFIAVSTAGGNDTIGNFLDGFKVGPVAEYRMDECYWLGDGVDDVKESSENGADGEAMNGAQITKGDAVINHAGMFDGKDDFIEVADNDAFDFRQTMSMTLWIKPKEAKDAMLAEKYYEESNGFFSSKAEGWRLYYTKGGRSFIGSSSAKLRLDMVIDGKMKSVSLEPKEWNDGSWHFIAVRYEGEELALLFDDQKDTTSAEGTITNARKSPLFIGAKEGKEDYFSGSMDEVKIFATALGNDEIARIKLNDENGNNYTGIKRETVSCGASVKEKTWDLVGIPADFRDPNNAQRTIADIFSNEMGGDYKTDWRIYRRNYSDTNNSSWYTLMDEKDELEFGVGYWLGSKISGKWSENGTVAVDYNASSNGTDECPATRCVEIPLVSVSLDSTANPPDELNGTGPYRYNVTGFVGKTPVAWADCRFIVSEKDGTHREVLTPSDANSSGYVSRQIWQYDQSSDSYTTCDDTMQNCLLRPYKGFWVELHGPTKKKSIRLLIPQE